MGMIVMTVIKCGHDDNAACGAVEQFDKAFISKTGWAGSFHSLVGFSVVSLPWLRQNHNS